MSQNQKDQKDRLPGNRSGQQNGSTQPAKSNLKDSSSKNQELKRSQRDTMQSKQTAFSEKANQDLINEEDDFEATEDPTEEMNKNKRNSSGSKKIGGNENTNRKDF